MTVSSAAAAQHRDRHKIGTDAKESRFREYPVGRLYSLLPQRRLSLGINQSVLRSQAVGVYCLQAA